MHEDQCIDCGNTYAVGEYSYCPHCGGPLELVDEPREPCEHEFEEISNSMVQCMLCGLIED